VSLLTSEERIMDYPAIAPRERRQPGSLAHTYHRFSVRGWDCTFILVPSNDIHLSCQPAHIERSLNGLQWAIQTNSRLRDLCGGEGPAYWIVMLPTGTVKKSNLWEDIVGAKRERLGWKYKELSTRFHPYNSINPWKRSSTSP